MEDNSKYYSDYIENKYEKSKHIYEKKFSTESVEDFLIAYEATNIYPTYPRPIIMNLVTKDDDIKIDNNKSYIFNNNKLNSITTLINNKIREYNKYKPQIKNITQNQKVRRLFDYEIRDRIKPNFPDSYITNAWTKLYELLASYNIFLDNKSDTIKTFHICEHPGAFIYATRDYIDKNFPDKAHKYIFQSLKPSTDKKIFKVEDKLGTSSSLDYGYDDTGDITHSDNIIYYGDTYRKEKFELITSDCGLDCSAEFENQETNLQKIFMGALLCAINIASDGTYYISKLFSFHTYKAIEMLYIGSYFFESVDIVRALTTKSGSGEVYIIYKNFKRPNNFDIIFKELIEYYENYDNIISFTSINSTIIRRIEKFAKLLAIRRIVLMNQLIFRIINRDYIENNQEVRRYVQKFADYYANYYLLYTKIEK